MGDLLGVHSRNSKVLYVALCYYCCGKGGNAIEPCSWESRLLSSLQCCVSNLLCGAWDFALFGGTHSSSADGWAFPLNPLKENFILESFLYFSFSIYLFLKDRPCLLCEANVKRVSSVLRTKMTPSLQRMSAVRACQRCLKMGRWRQLGFPHRPNTIALNIQQRYSSKLQP